MGPANAHTSQKKKKRRKRLLSTIHSIQTIIALSSPLVIMSNWITYFSFSLLFKLKIIIILFFLKMCGMKTSSFAVFNFCVFIWKRKNNNDKMCINKR